MGLNPDELGSPLGAAARGSFALAFAVGAALPLVRVPVRERGRARCCSARSLPASHCSASARHCRCFTGAAPGVPGTRTAVAGARSPAALCHVTWDRTSFTWCRARLIASRRRGRLAKRCGPLRAIVGRSIRPSAGSSVVLKPDATDRCGSAAVAIRGAIRARRGRAPSR